MKQRVIDVTTGNLRLTLDVIRRNCGAHGKRCNADYRINGRVVSKAEWQDRWRERT